MLIFSGDTGTVFAPFSGNKNSQGEFVMVQLKIFRISIYHFLFSLDFIKLLNRFRSNLHLYSIIIIGFICCIPDVKGAFDKKEVGASSFALGNAVVAIDQYLFALYYNPAALSTEGKFQTAFSIQNYFGIGDLNAIDIMINFSLFKHPFSFAINRFGNRYYQEIQLTAASRYELFEKCSIGFSVQYYLLSIQNHGQSLSWGVNISALYNLTPNVSIGALVTNLNQPVISSTLEKIPQTMSLGFCYNPVSDLEFSFEVFQDIRFDQEYRAGVSYQVIPLLKLRAGIEDQLNVYSYGFGINMAWMIFDYGLRNHPVLGISHIVTLSILL